MVSPLERCDQEIAEATAALYGGDIEEHLALLWLVDWVLERRLIEGEMKGA